MLARFNLAGTPLKQSGRMAVSVLLLILPLSVTCMLEVVVVVVDKGDESLAMPVLAPAGLAAAAAAEGERGSPDWTSQPSHEDAS